MTNDYSQPDFYRFNEDSIKLVRYVINKNLESTNVLDVCAGSGVIGIEYAQLKKVKKLVFVELQRDFQIHLHMNIQQFLSDDVETEVYITPLSKFYPEEKFDLILANPPYYLPDSGRISPDEKRAIARSFIIDGWESFFQLTLRSLSDNGKAFIVLKKDFKLQQFLSESCPKELIITIEEQLDLIFVCFEHKLRSEFP